MNIFVCHQVYDFVKLDEVYYAGSHGMDIVGPPTNTKSYDDKYQINTQNEKGKEFTIYQPAKEYLPSIKKVMALFFYFKLLKIILNTC